MTVSLSSHLRCGLLALDVRDILLLFGLRVRHDCVLGQPLSLYRSLCGIAGGEAYSDLLFACLCGSPWPVICGYSRSGYGDEAGGVCWSSTRSSTDVEVEARERCCPPWRRMRCTQRADEPKVLGLPRRRIPNSRTTGFRQGGSSQASDQVDASVRVE